MRGEAKLSVGMVVRLFSRMERLLVVRIPPRTVLVHQVLLNDVQLPLVRVPGRKPDSAEAGSLLARTASSMLIGRRVARKSHSRHFEIALNYGICGGCSGQRRVGANGGRTSLEHAEAAISNQALGKKGDNHSEQLSV